MRYYTKEWYHLMQHQHDLSGFRKIPDKVYSDRDIRAFYEQDRKAAVAAARRSYNTPPDFRWYEELLQPDRFDPRNFLLTDPQTGADFHPETPEAARRCLEAEARAEEARFAARPPFDPAEAGKEFQETYRGQLRWGGNHFPQWVRDTVDKRLIALNRMPEQAYRRLRQEERAHRRAFAAINKKAEQVLEAQDIPAWLRARFFFHDAHVLRLQKQGGDAVLLLRNDGSPEAPYCAVTFHAVSMLERERGLVLRPRPDDEGLLISNCQYLYEELYRTGQGYEVHMLLWTPSALRYLTVGCGSVDIQALPPSAPEISAVLSALAVSKKKDTT